VVEEVDGLLKGVHGKVASRAFLHQEGLELEWKVAVVAQVGTMDVVLVGVAVAGVAMNRLADYVVEHGGSMVEGARQSLEAGSSEKWERVGEVVSTIFGFQ
jgi:hypothetical protein